MRETLTGRFVKDEPQMQNIRPPTSEEHKEFLRKLMEAAYKAGWKHAGGTEPPKHQDDGERWVYTKDQR